MLESKAREEFEYWLFEMDDELEKFLSSIQPLAGGNLDFSPGSLDILERWMLGRYPNTTRLLEPSEKHVLDGAARYIGETFRKQLGGYWDISLDDPNYVYHGIPQLTGFGENPTPLCPHSLATAAVDRKTGNFLRTVLENAKRRLSDKR